MSIFENVVYEQQRINIENLYKKNPNDWFYKSQMEKSPEARTGFAPRNGICHNCGKNITEGEKGITLDDLGSYIITAVHIVISVIAIEERNLTMSTKYFDADSIQTEIKKACEEYGISYGKEKGGFAKRLAEITEKVNTQVVLENNKANLFCLIAENPNLPIVPMVDSEIGCEDYARCMGSFGCAWVDEYCLSNDRMWCKSDFDNDINDALETILPWHKFEKIPDGGEKEAYDNLPWTKAILVNIDLP